MKRKADSSANHSAGRVLSDSGLIEPDFWQEFSGADDAAFSFARPAPRCGALQPATSRGGACGWRHRTFSFDRRMTSAVALFLEREDVSDGASGSDEAEAARPPAGALQM